MIYFTFYEILRFSFVMLIFGAGFVIFELSASIILKSLKSLPYFIKLAFYDKGVFRKIGIKFKAESQSALYLFFIDFISILSFSVFFILLSYAFYDGILRIYFFLISLVSYWVSKKLYGKKLEFILEKLISVLFAASITLISILLIPVKISARILKILYRPLGKKLKSERSKRISNKKLREIDVFFRKNIIN